MVVDMEHLPLLLVVVVDLVVEEDIALVVELLMVDLVDQEIHPL